MEKNSSAFLTKALGGGIGGVTVSMFWRELRETRKNTNPNITELLVLAPEKLGLPNEDAAQNNSK